LWYVFYISNYYFVHIGKFDSALSHFWSLAVEEQFYLFWPLLILLIPKKYLFYVIFLLILIAPVHRVLMGPDYYNSSVYTILTVDCLDYLGMGALLALIQSNIVDIKVIELMRRYKKHLSWGIIIVFIGFYILSFFGISNYITASFQGTTLSALFALLVYKASKGFRGIAGKILEFPPIVYLGKISYGLYVYHVFAKYFIPLIFSLFSAKHLIENNFALNLISMGIWTVIVASVSWYFYEKPINNLKRKFPYY